MNWIGLDIGGANIKVAGTDGTAHSAEFPLWKDKHGLPGKLQQLLPQSASPYRIAVTMTGELADCFQSKREGVKHIVESVVESGRADTPVFYQTNGKFVAAEEAISAWQLTAAANWHALATFVSRFMPANRGILVDVGSTTTDIIPVVDGKPCSQGLTDTQRLQSGELVYTGILRSPVNGLLDDVLIDGLPTRVANELFGTTLDAHVYLGHISPSFQTGYTADGRPATIECAAQRLARVVCADVTEIGGQNVRVIAEAVVAAQVKLISKALDQVVQTNPSLMDCVVISGHGGWLIEKLLRDRLNGSELIALEDVVSRAAAQSAPALAVAQLAHESK